MKVINRTSYPIIAFGYHTKRGYAEDVTVQPGETAEVSGPYLGEMGGGLCYVHLEGQIVCQETPNDDVGFQVIQGLPLRLVVGETGITVRHHMDEPEQHVIAWRQANPRETSGSGQPGSGLAYWETH